MASSGENGSRSVLEVAANARLQQAIALLEKDLTKRFHVPQLARESGLSVRCFHQVFKQETGMTFVGFYRNVRMTRARELLTDTDQPIKAIAFDLGYLRVEVFDHEFKQVHSCAPSEYRARCRNGQ